LASRYKDWLEQARWDLKAARDSLKAENYEWSCFQSQQAAEKSLKAYLGYQNLELREHMIINLLRRVEDFVAVPEYLFNIGKRLDLHYIQTRYPNSLASGYPHSFYDENLAKECYNYAEEILSFVEREIK